MISRPQSNMQYQTAGSSATRYQESLWDQEGSEAREYLLETRGLDAELVGTFGLGYVASPEPGHEQYRGRICIPYFNARGVTTLRFRGMPGREGNAKYLDMAGAKPLLYNITALLQGGNTLYVAEGELDTITATQMGLRTVGLSGAQKWQPHYRNLLTGYSRVIVLCDSDDDGVGLELGNLIKAKLPDAFVQLKPAPEGHDVNSAYVELGAQELLNHWRIDPEDD